jgi:hypothetical protein
MGKKMRITNDNITKLNDNQIFVFGSNESGRHGRGAAKTALKFGAIYGQARGLQGKTYGIPTVNASVTDKLTLDKVEKYVNEFIEFTKQHEELEFHVTEIGCGLAGFTVKEIAPLFKEALTLENVYLPLRFIRKILGETI